MTGRKQNLVLFFKENEKYHVINSRLVRMYMNRFTIDEEHQTEVTEVYYIKSGTRKEYNECFSKSLKMERENKTANTDTHFILGYETITESTYEYPLRSLVFQLSKLIANHHSRSGNCHAITFLSSSIEHKMLSKIAQRMADHESQYKKRMAYQYQKQDAYEPKSFWRRFLRSCIRFLRSFLRRLRLTAKRLTANSSATHGPYHGGDWATEKFKQSINDDLEWFQSRILENAIYSNVDSEIIKTFHYQMLDDNQVEDLKNSIAEHNKNLPFLDRFYAYLEKTNSNHTYARFNCKRITMYLNDGTRRNGYVFWMEVIAANVVFYYSMTSEYAFQTLLTLFLMILFNLLDLKTIYFRGRLFRKAVVGIGLFIGIPISGFFALYRYTFNVLAAFCVFYVWINLIFLYGFLIDDSSART